MEKSFDFSDSESDADCQVIDVETDFDFNSDEGLPSPAAASYSLPQPQPASEESVGIFRTNSTGNEDSSQCGSSHGTNTNSTGENNGRASPTATSSLAAQLQIEMVSISDQISDGDKSSQDDLYSRVKRRTKRNAKRIVDYGYFNSINDSDEDNRINKNGKRPKNRYEEQDNSPRPGTDNTSNCSTFPYGSDPSNDDPEDYKRKNLTLLETLFSSLVGQDEAIETFNSAIVRKQNGWVDEKRPMVFLFLGSSGIGKTELAKLTANYLCKKKDVGAFIRIDMSEYQERHSVAKFIGSPPGYVGYEDGGQLTNALKKHPQAMVLFDEVDKAAPDVLTILLQLFDEGRLTDGRGRTIIVKNSIFVMTSNLGSKEIAEHILHLRKASERVAKERLVCVDGDIDDDEVEEKIKISSSFKQKVIRKILKSHFKRDDFIGRINEIIYFYPFSVSEIDQLIGKELKFWGDKAKKNHDIELKWDNSVYKASRQGYDIHYGARSIKHHVEHEIVSQIAKADASGQLQRSCQLRISAQEVSSNSSGRREVEYKIMLQIKPKGEDKFQLIHLGN